MKTIALLTVVVSFLLAGSLLVGAVQNSLKAQKALTPEQLRAQRGFAESQSEADRLRAQAKQAFSAEVARATRQGGDCPQAKTTYDQVQCLEREAGQTVANYKASATALRALLAQPGSDDDHATKTPVGPAGPALTPAQSAAEFDKTEQLWRSYRDSLCTAAFHQGGGGTISPVLQGECHLQATRNHMRDLNSVYGLLLESR